MAFIDGDNGPNSLIGTASIDNIEGFAGDDTIQGLGNGDIIDGGQGNDSILGGEGDDQIEGGAKLHRSEWGSTEPKIIGDTGNDTIDGGAGRDEVQYNYWGSAREGINVDLAAGTAISNYGQDVLISIEDVSGTELADTLRGSTAPNEILGDSGNDLIEGRGDGDDLDGSSGLDTIFGGDGDDTINGGSGNDSVEGGIDNDTIEGYSGDDTLVGGPGVDNIRGYWFNEAGGDDRDVVVVTPGMYLDLFLDFEKGFDLIDVRPFVLTWAALQPLISYSDWDTDGDSDAVVTFNASDQLIVKNVAAGGLAATDFIVSTTPPTTIFPGTGGDDNYCGANGGDQAPGFVDDLMTGQGGNDCFSPKGGLDTVFGGTGVDTLDYSATSIVFGAPPAGAVINLASGVSTDPWGNADFTLELENAQGTEHGDWLVGTEADNNVLLSWGGADTVVGLGGADTIDLGAGNDQSYGYAGNDTVYGGAGNDTAYGSEGVDLLYGGLDNDLLVGGADNDAIYGEAGNDLMFGEGGDDYIDGGDGDDVADGGDGRDGIDLGPGNNFGFAGAGIDTVIGNSGQDVLFGQGDGDYLAGGEALDNLLGGPGNDTLDGGGAGDNLLGEASDDVIYGGGGNDVLDGGAGIDQLFGQAGSDTFVHRSGQGSSNSATPDVIADFQGAGGGGFPEDDFLFLDVLAGGATFAPAGGGLAADVWKLTDGAVTEYLKITGVTSLVQGVDYGFF